MTNNVLTHDIVAKEAAAMLIEESVFIKSINRGREQEFNKDKAGYKVGSQVRIKIPPVPVVTDGKEYQSDDADLNAQENTRILKVDTQKHVSLEFGAAEQTLSLTQFKDRFLKPAIQSLATTVDADLLKRAIVTVNNSTLIGANETSPLAPFGRAREMLARSLTPSAGRIALLSSEFTNGIVDTSGTLFNPNAEIAKQYKEGYVGRARGFDFVESEHIYRQVNGLTTGITVSGAGQTGGFLTVGGLSNGDVIKAGQVFTLPDVEMLHPLTRLSYGKLMQFVVLEDVEAGGATATLKIYPEITPDMIGTDKQANSNVTASPANDAGLTFVGGDDDVIDQALCYTKDAFSAAFAPLKVLAGCEGYTFNTETMALRVQTGGNWVSDFEGTRIDVLYGFTMVRGNHAARVGRID
ncbi:P22 phage major capsid protein family protein [Acinetobacter haemolyticus]|uniref:P22 phage major capsid protein family protein n=1 Tax=Acinetobacter haemolyticus TaxID=29430 RepID=UPI003F5542E6